MEFRNEDQSNLFDEKRPRIALQPKQKAELAAAVNALLHEIAVALAKPVKPVKPATTEAGHEQDHG
jgi:hypothetical protein